MTTATGSESAWSTTLRRRGATVLALFAVLWVAVAASGLSGGAAWALRGSGLAVGLALVALAARPGPRPGERARRQPDGWHRGVGTVNLVQLAAIAAIVVVCLVAGAPQLVPPLVALEVGLHFLPLARLFDQPEYRVTAAGLVVAAVVSLVVLVAVGEAPSRVVVGALAAATLWGTAVALLAPRSAG